MQDELDAILDFEKNKEAKQQQLNMLMDENNKKNKLKSTLEIEEQNELRRQQEILTHKYSLQQQEDKLKAKTNAEKNISEIERNIQDQNIRLDKEVRL